MLASEALYQEIFSLNRIAYALCNLERKIYTSNPQFSYLLDLSIDDIDDYLIEDVFYELIGLEKDIQQVQKRIISPIKIEKIERQFANGQIGYITITIAPIFQTDLLILVEDVTVQGKLEQRITQQRNEIALLAQELKTTRAQLDDLLHRFVPSAVADMMIANPKQAKLGGIRQEVTVLFADLRGFTTWAEKLEPEMMVEQLNKKLTVAVEAVLALGGTLDKFMGDAIMGLFNAPSFDPDHAFHAVQAAWNFISALQDETSVRFSAGIHTGTAVLGNIGTLNAMNYTAIGDAVNQAKRLQEMALAGQLYISQATYERVKERVSVQPMGYQTLKGRLEPVIVYAVTDIYI